MSVSILIFLWKCRCLRSTSVNTRKARRLFFKLWALWIQSTQTGWLSSWFKSKPKDVQKENSEQGGPAQTVRFDEMLNCAVFIKSSIRWCYWWSFFVCIYRSHHPLLACIPPPSPPTCCSPTWHASIPAWHCWDKSFLKKSRWVMLRVT